MLTLIVDCSNHQVSTPPREFTVTLETVDAYTKQRLKHGLEQQGWVVQFNGEHMDTYCTKKCAE